MSELKNLFGDEVKMHDRNALAKLIENHSSSTADGSEPAEKIYGKLLELDSAIDELSQRDYDVSSVFITFEKEEMQRTVLRAMTVPRMKPDLLDERYKFHGHVLTLSEADEPSSIRWGNLDNPRLVRFYLFFCNVLLYLYPNHIESNFCSFTHTSNRL